MSFPPKLFPPKQIEDLQKAGFAGLYELLNYFPSKLEQIEPLDKAGFIDANKLYLWQARLISSELRSGKKPFFLLNLSDGQSQKTAYLFSNARYLHTLLQVGSEFQLILKYKDPFWTVDKIAAASPTKMATDFILGKAIMQNYLVPKYTRILALTSPRFNQIFRRLPSSFFLLDFTGLVPNNSNLQSKIDLTKIHKPTSEAEFYETKKQFLKVKVFLQMVTLKALQDKTEQLKARKGKLDLEFLKTVSSNLPYQLTLSQKTVIWDILGVICG